MEWELIMRQTQGAEEFYKNIRNSVFDEISPAEILREKQDNPEQIKLKIRNICLQTIQASKRILPIEYQEQIINRLLNEIFGFGMIQPLLEDSSISEIMINGPESVYIERDGKLFNRVFNLNLQVRYYRLLIGLLVLWAEELMNQVHWWMLVCQMEAE